MRERWRSGSTGRSGRAAPSGLCSPSQARYLAAGAAILAPAVTGHAGQTSPRGLAIPVDWIHIAAGAVWIGGLIGLLVIAATHRAPGLVKVVPRFSNVAFVSVLALIAAGIGNSLFHLPTLASLWETSYGKMVLIKIGVLAVAMLVASGNLLRNAPRLRAAERRPDLAEGAASSLWKLVSVEVVLVVGIIFCAALLTSLAPPSSALAKAGKANASVGPGAVTTRGPRERLPGRAANRAQPRRGRERLLDQDHEGRPAGPGRARHHRLLDAGHGDGDAVV